MNVTNLPINRRLELFEDWYKEVNSRNGSFSFGNEIDLTPEQINDPSYIIPEWGCGVPHWMCEEKLGDKVGKLCKCNASGIEGTLLGVQCTYEDFYYKIKDKLTGEIIYDTACSHIEFLED